MSLRPSPPASLRKCRKRAFFAAVSGWREIIATGAVTIGKTGVLDGNVTAKSLAIEQGGIFSGGLVIGQGDLAQAELLPQAQAEAPATEELPISTPSTQPLPAT